MVGLHQPGMLGRLAAEQRTAGDHAALGDAGDDRTDPFRDGAAHGDVVLEEQRFGAADDEVVDHHGHQVQADGVVDVHRLGDGEFGTDAVGGGRQDRFAVPAAERE